MARIAKFFTKTLSVRISQRVVLAIAILLTIALAIMSVFLRKAVKEEAFLKAEQTLETTIQHIDNVLLSIEQSAGNIYWDMLLHLDEPDRMLFYSKKIVEANPYIAGCAIAFEPNYYQQKGELFMAYIRREYEKDSTDSTTHLVQSETFGSEPYTVQEWYSTPIETGKPCWSDPIADLEAENGRLITFSLPIYNREGRTVGVVGVDISLDLLSKIMLIAKPSPHSFAILIGKAGAFIVHPDSNRLFHQTVFTMTQELSDPTVKTAVDEMMAGKTGYSHFKAYGTDNYIFYKPFKRSEVPGRAMDDLGWNTGIIYPEQDILGEYYRLLNTVIAIGVIGLLLLFILVRYITHRQLLPLRGLTISAQRIAEGHYDDIIPDTWQEDEVGRLQTHFQQMQKALATNMGELRRLTTDLQQNGEVLAEAYEQARKADNMKTAVLHNMTSQMMTPVNAISTSAGQLFNGGSHLQQQQVDQLTRQIQEQGKVVIELLNDLLVASQENENPAERR